MKLTVLYIRYPYEQGKPVHLISRNVTPVWKIRKWSMNCHSGKGTQSWCIWEGKAVRNICATRKGVKEERRVVFT